MAKIQVKVNKKPEGFEEHYITIPGPGDVMIRMTESEARKLKDDLTVILGSITGGAQAIRKVMTNRCPSLKNHRPHSWDVMVAVGGDVALIDRTGEWPVREIERVRVRYDCPGLDDALDRYIEMYWREEE